MDAEARGGFRRTIACAIVLAVSPVTRARAQGDVPPPDDAVPPACAAAASVPRDCPPVAPAGAARRRALEELDAAGRRAVTAGRLSEAARAFGCLLAEDRTYEVAGNLAVVLREMNDLSAARDAASCAEALAPPNHRGRAEQRRRQIEARLDEQSPPPAAPIAPVAPIEPAARSSGSAATTSEPPPWARPASRGLLAGGGVALAAAGVVYLMARGRANQFDDEQTSSGFSPRAQSLREEASELRAASVVTAALGLALAAGGAALAWRF